MRVEHGHARATFLYADGARHLSLDRLNVSSLVIDGSRGVATLRGSVDEMPGRRRVYVTVAFESHSRHRQLRIRLSSGYHESGPLLAGFINFVRNATR